MWQVNDDVGLALHSKVGIWFSDEMQNSLIRNKQVQLFFTWDSLSRLPISLCSGKPSHIFVEKGCRSMLEHRRGLFVVLCIILMQ